MMIGESRKVTVLFSPSCSPREVHVVTWHYVAWGISRFQRSSSDLPQSAQVRACFDLVDDVTMTINKSNRCEVKAMLGCDARRGKREAAFFGGWSEYRFSSSRPSCMVRV